MRSVKTVLRFSLVAFVALVVARVDAQEVPDVNGDYDVTDADIPDSASIFYVRTNGNDANTGLSPSQAFRTIRRAAIMVPAGSTIYVGAGTYTDSTTFLGVESTASWPLRIVADVNGIRTGDSGPVILGPGTRMTILRCDNVRVIGFTFQGPTDRCFVWRRSTQGHVQDCTFIGGSMGVKVRSGDVTFQGCLVQDFVATGIDVYGTAELFLDDCDVENCGSAGLRMHRYAKVTIESSRFLNNAGDGVALDDISSTDDDLATIPLSQRIEDARNLLAATMPDATKKGSDKMADAILRLDVALLAKYWQDPWHPHNKQTKDAARDMGLDADEGFEVFKKIKEALDKLKDFNNPDKDVELGNFGTVKSNVQLVHAWLLEATEATAFLALEEAFLVNSDTDVLKDFYKEYKKAAKECDKGHYHHAAEKYGKAWEDAAKEAGSGYASLDGVGTDNDDAPDAETARFLTITASTFNSNANGINCVIAPTLDLRTSDLSNNTQSGLYLIGGGIVEDCTITGNEKGVFLKDVTDLSTVKRLTVNDNLESGLYAEDCVLTFNSTNIDDWSISGSPYVIAGKDSDMTFSSVTISGGSTAAVSIVDGTMQASYTTFSDSGYGVSSTNSDFALSYCTLSGNTTGLYANQNTSLQVNNSTFTGSTRWGASITPKTAGGLSVIFDACTFHSNAGALALVNAVDGQVSLRSGTLMRDNTNSGLHFENCNLTINDQGGGTAWRTLRNGYGISSTGSTLTLSNVSAEESSLYGVYCEDSSVSLANCTVTGVGGVYADAANDSLTVESTRFDASSAGGWGVARYGGNLDVKNCVLNGFDGGVFLFTASGSDQAAINNSTLVNLATYGVYLTGGDATVQNTLLVGGSTASGLTQVSGQLTHSHNLLDGFGTPFSGTTADASELLKNPRFVDAANGDFRLAKGSPAINSGTDLTASGVTVDMLGNTRPSYNVFEIGAYEYMQNGGSLRVLSWKENK